MSETESQHIDAIESLETEVKAIQIQYDDIKNSFTKINERLNGMGKLMLEQTNRFEEIASELKPPVERITHPNKSETTGKIAAALSKAQREMGGIAGSGSANRGSFTTLEDMEEVCAPILEKYELAVSCQLITNELGEFVLVMLLTHASNEWLEARALIRDDQSQQSLPFHQKVGAAEKYMKRYMYRAMLCLADNSKD